MPRILKGCQLGPERGNNLVVWVTTALDASRESPRPHPGFSPGAESLANAPPPSNRSPLPIHGCAPTARKGRRRKRLVLQRWTAPGTARNDAIAHRERALASPALNFCESSELGTWNLELRLCFPNSLWFSNSPNSPATPPTARSEFGEFGEFGDIYIDLICGNSYLEVPEYGHWQMRERLCRQSAIQRQHWQGTARRLPGGQHC
jgi:hypothetical protein